MVLATSLVNSFFHSYGRYGYRRFELNDGHNEPVSRILTPVKGCTTTHHGFRGTPIFRTPGTKSTIKGLIIRGLGKRGPCRRFRRRARVGAPDRARLRKRLNTAPSLPPASSVRTLSRVTKGDDSRPVSSHSTCGKWSVFTFRFNSSFRRHASSLFIWRGCATRKRGVGPPRQGSGVRTLSLDFRATMDRAGMPIVEALGDGR